MTVVATITRKLNIRFIDARQMETMARLNLGITEYPNAEQTEQIVKEVTRIFYDEISLEERRTMRLNREVLAASVKPDIDDDGKSLSTISTESSTFRSSSSFSAFLSPTKPQQNKNRANNPSPNCASSLKSPPNRGIQAASLSVDLPVPDLDTSARSSGSKMKKFVLGR